MGGAHPLKFVVALLSEPQRRRSLRHLESLHAASVWKVGSAAKVHKRAVPAGMQEGGGDWGYVDWP